MLLLFLFTGLLYFVLLVTFMVGWQRVIGQLQQPQQEFSVSVIIPFRNEMHHLPALLGALKNQSYNKVEFLFVDDHSTDSCVEQIQSIVGTDKRFQVIVNNGQGKKQAITTGVQFARGEIILTTDADCTMEPEWVQSMVRCFSEPDVMLTIGPVILNHNNSWWGRLQQAEFVSLIASAAAGVGVGYPFMCNGANLAYRRAAFEKVGGYSQNQHVASGDDEFLMRSINQEYQGSVRFQSHKNSIVFTQATPSIKEFWFQRLRWASKWKYNTFHVQILAIGVLLVHAVFIGGMFYSVASSDFGMRIAALAMLLIKMLCELVFLKQVSDYWGVSWNWAAFITLQVVHPFYVVLTGLFSNFMPNAWKGRPIQ